MTLTLDTPTTSETELRLSRRVAGVVLGAIVAAYLGIGGLVAAVLPYHSWDAFAYGAWSRWMAEDGSFHPPWIYNLALQRPVFYVLQGGLWWVFGFHWSVARLLSFAFTLLLVACVVVLGRRTPLRLVGGLLAAVVLLLIPEFQLSMAIGLTDVPAAAFLALLAIVLWVPARVSRLQVAAVALLTALAVLTKPTSLLVVAGLVAAEVIFSRSELRARLALLAAVGAGSLAALVYEVSQAGYLNESLLGFLEGGDREYYLAQGAALRLDTALRLDWLGRDLRPLLCFALVYTVVRLLMRHRVAAGAGLAAAVVGTWITPSLAGDDKPFASLVDGLGSHDVVQLALVAFLAFSLRCPDDEAPSRRWLSRLLVVAALPTAVWVYRESEAYRLLSPAWPFLALLLAAALAAPIAGARRVRPALQLAPVVLLAWAALLALPNVDGLGKTGWRHFWSGGPGLWTDRAQVQAYWLGPLDDEVRAVAAEVGPAGRVISSDLRLLFFFPRQLEYAYPESCAALAGYDSFVLLHDPDSAAAMEARRPGGSSASFWSACRSPRVAPVRQVDGSFTVFAVGNRACASRDRAHGLVAVFGSELSRRDADALRARAVSVGFGAARLEQVSCDAYDVVLSGFTSRAGADDFAAEAARAGFRVQIVERP